MEIQIRRITLADGRYLIFYTFNPKLPDSAAPFRDNEAALISETDEESRV
jgi:hypothetical protein